MYLTTTVTCVTFMAIYGNSPKINLIFNSENVEIGLRQSIKFHSPTKGRSATIMPKLIFTAQSAEFAA